MSGLSLGTCASNLKSVGLTVLELWAFNAQKIRGHVTLATPLLENFLGVMSGLSLRTRLSNLKSVALTVLELLAFNSHWSAAHTQTDKQTHIERTHYLRHSLRSLGGDKERKKERKKSPENNTRPPSGGGVKQFHSILTVLRVCTYNLGYFCVW